MSLRARQQKLYNRIKQIEEIANNDIDVWRINSSELARKIGLKEKTYIRYKRENKINIEVLVPPVVIVSIK